MGALHLARGEYDSGGQVALTLELLAPELKPGLEEFRAAQNDQEKRFAAILLILRMPGLRPYVSAGLGRTTPIDKVDSFQDTGGVH